MKSMLQSWFEIKLSERRIKRKLDSIKPLPEASVKEGSTIKAACVQRSIHPVTTVEKYIDMVNGFVRDAAAQGCDIIAFPEYNFFDLFGVIPGFSWLNAYLNKKAVSPKSGGIRGDGSSLYPVLKAVSTPVQKAIEAIMCGLAEKYRIHIYTGSYFIQENGCLYNGGALLSREGIVLGRQKKLHLTDFEEKMGIRRSEEFKVFSLDIGKVACPVCMDATYYETFNIARSLGCDIVIIPIANNEEYSRYRALRGIWPRVQESHVYGIKASLNGWLGGMHFTGKAGVFAPLVLTSKGDGVVSISKHFEGDSLITGNISLEELYRERKEDEYYGDSNPEFERDYYSKTYKGVLEDEE